MSADIVRGWEIVWKMNIWPRSEASRASVKFWARCEKDLKDNKDNSLHLRRKYARTFVLGHYLFLAAHSFPRASLSENRSLLATDNVRGQISEHIFAPNADYLTIIPRAHEAEGRMGYWLRARAHEGERNNCFSKIQLVGQENIEKKHL